MSELAIRQDTRRSFYTETEGNITRLFWDAPADDQQATEQLSLFGFAADATAPFDMAATETTPVLPVEPDHGLTARQKELAKPDSKDMAVEPLESYDQVRGMISYFERQRQYREACLLTFGFCTGLRISDLLNLKIGDIVESVSPMAFKRAIDIREQKTGKRTVGHLDDMLVTPAMQEAFKAYYATKDIREIGLDRYLFTTIRTYGRKPMCTSHDDWRRDKPRHCLSDRPAPCQRRYDPCLYGDDEVGDAVPAQGRQRLRDGEDEAEEPEVRVFVGAGRRVIVSSRPGARGIRLSHTNSVPSTAAGRSLNPSAAHRNRTDRRAYAFWTSERPVKAGQPQGW